MHASDEQSKPRGNVCVVVIGRNEGTRLERSLRAVLSQTQFCVYVDSGSTDGSPDLAAQLGAAVVNLSSDLPFTAARGRNEGFAASLLEHPETCYVQFVDGDTELIPAWLDAGARALDEDAGLAAVCGHLFELEPNRSVYSRLCAAEWDRPPGLVRACGGNIMVRVSAFASEGGFRSDMPAGEEPELCARWRSNGWQIRRLDADMGIHDSGMLHFAQWWVRTKRSGYAWAEECALHGSNSDRLGLKPVLSALFWGLVLPIAVIALTVMEPSVGFGIAILYPLQIGRIVYRQRSHSARRRSQWLVAFFLILGKLPEAFGVLTYVAGRLRGMHRRPTPASH